MTSSMLVTPVMRRIRDLLSVKTAIVDFTILITKCVIPALKQKMAKYSGKHLLIKDGKATEVIPSPYLVETKDADGNVEQQFVEPSNPFYTIVGSYGKIKN